LKRGVIDFGRDVPPADTALVSTSAALVTREDLHPALASLMAEAILHVSRTPVIDPYGRSQVFARLSSFPTSTDPEFPMQTEARRIYTSGPPLLQRMGLPFWFATLADRLMVMLLPIIGVAMPLMKLVPMVYTWRIRSRIFHWYGELKALEQQLKPSLAPEEIAEKLAEVDRIEEFANNTTVPLGFANILFDLRQHIEIVRRRIAGLQARQMAAPAAA
jgi:hypothetical protein